MKLDFSKSRNQDLQNKIPNYQFEIMNKNILYVTHQVDKILIIVRGLENVLALQKQVDDYFEAKPGEPPLEDMAQDGNSSSSQRTD